jgi:hypothetical protein
MEIPLKVNKKKVFDDVERRKNKQGHLDKPRIHQMQRMPQMRDCMLTASREQNLA